MRRERPHPLTHRASRLLWGRSRLSHAQRVPFGRVPEAEFRSCKTTSITPRKGESKDKDQSPRSTTQDGNLPRFMMSRASKASWTGMLNSVMILVFLTLWLPRGFANFPKKTNFLIEVFPFRGLLIVGGSIASKSLDRCLQSGKVNGAPVSDAMEVLEGASEWPVPEREMANHKDSP